MSLLGDLFESLLKGGAIEGGEVAAGDVLSAIGLGEPTADTQKVMQDFSDEAEQLEADVKSILNDLDAAEYYEIQSALEQNASLISTDYKYLSQLKKGDVDDYNRLMDYWGDPTQGVAVFSSVVKEIGGAAGGAGLLQAAVKWASDSAIKGTDYARGEFGEDSNLYRYYLKMQNFFDGALSLQAQGLDLVVNALHARQDFDDADNVTAEYTAQLDSQCHLFLKLVEQYTATYCQDMLLDLFTDPAYNKVDENGAYQGTDPVRLAGLFVDSAQKTDTLYARVWAGKGGGKHPFDTGTYVDEGDGPDQLGTYIGLSGDVPPDAAEYVLFDCTQAAAGGDGGDGGGGTAGDKTLWGVYRFAWYDDAVATEGTYSFTNGAANSSAFLPCSINGNPICNVMAKRTGGGPPFTSENESFTFAPQTPRGSYYTVFTGVTALLLDGGTGFVKVDANDAQHDVGGGDFSVEAWILPDGEGQGAILGNSYNKANQYCLRLKDDGTLQFELAGQRAQVGKYGVTTKKGAGPNLYDGNWHHIAAVRRGDALDIYVDGRPADSSVDKDKPQAASTLNVSGKADLYIGAHSYGTNDHNLNEFFGGRMMEVRLWNKALDPAADIQANMYRHLTGGEKSLRGYWRMDNGNVSDVSLNGDGELKKGAKIVLRMGSNDIAVASG